MILFDKKQHEQQVQLDFIDDISESRQPRAIASYTFCPLFVMMIACYLPDLGRWRLPRPCFAPADAVSDPRKNTRFCVNPTRFSLFFERRRGWGREAFVNEGEHAGGREAARGRIFWVAICWVAVGCMVVEDWG